MEPSTSPIAARRDSITSTSLEHMPTDALLQRRRSQSSKTSTNFQKEHSVISEIANAIESNEPLDAEQMKTFSRIIRSEIRGLEDELKGKCTTTQNYYPH